MSDREDFPPIPRIMLEAAQAKSLTELEIARAWREYVRWHRKTLVDEPWRMADWSRQVAFTCRDKAVREDVVQLPDTCAMPTKASAREAEAREKALADEAYKRGAVSYAAWLERLRDQATWGDEIPTEELTPRNAERRRKGLPLEYSHASGLAFLESLRAPLLPYVGHFRPMPTSGVHLVTHPTPPADLSAEEVTALREAERAARERQT